MRKRGKSRRLGTIDLDTGESVEGIPVYCKAKVRWHEDWCMIMQEALGTLAQDKDFSLETWRVWSYLVSKLGFENWIAIPQKEIAEALGMQKQNVNRTIKKLLNKGILLKGPKVGRTNAFKLNSKYGWKGSINNLSEDRMGVVKDFQEEAAKRNSFKNP